MDAIMRVSVDGDRRGRGTESNGMVNSQYFE